MATDQEFAALCESLKDVRSAARRSAAKRLRKLANPAACAALTAALDHETADKRTWETQYHLAMALGESGCTAARELLKSLLDRDVEPMVTLAVGDALVRLASKLGDVSRTLQEIYSRPLSRAPSGGVRACAMLGLRPDPPTISTIIHHARAAFERDPRDDALFWPAAAAVNWSGDGVKEFLEFCVAHGTKETKEAAAASLAGKRKKWTHL